MNMGDFRGAILSFGANPWRKFIGMFASAARRIKSAGRPLSSVRSSSPRKPAPTILAHSERLFSALSEERYRDLVESTHDLVQSIAPDGHFVFANRVWFETLGYTKEELPQLTITDIIHPESLAHCQQQFARVMAGESVAGVEAKFLTKDGREIFVEGSVSPRFHEGRIAASHGFFRDVTQPKLVEKELSRSEEQYRALVEQAPDAIFIVDPGLHFIDLNARACELSGYTKDGILRMSILDFMAPEDIVSAPLKLNELREGKTVVAERRFRRKDGTLVPVEVSSKILSDGRLQAIVRDITERRRAEGALQESEERFRQLSEAAFEAIILHDQGTILEVNQSFCRMYGYERAEVIGKSVLDLALPEFRELLLQTVRSGDTDSYEGPALRKDGTTFRAELAGKPIHYQGRTVRVAAIRDITEQKRNERRQAAQYAVTRVLTESATLADAVPQLLQAICESLRWKMGEFWRVCDSTNLLRCVETWHVPELDATSFIEASRQTELAPGTGLPGRVWQSGQPAWSPDVMADPRFARAAIAAKVGLRGAVAFPILLGNHTLGVMQFFSRRTPEVDEDLLKIMSAIGSQIGQFTERKRAEEALLVSERKYRDIFTFAPVGIYQSLRDGTLITANKALAEMLGYASVDELLKVKLGAGMYSAEDEREKLIREYEGLGYALDLDMQWKRKDGSPICVQLSAQAIKGPNGETEYFEGFLRDITERKQVDEKLRESEEKYRTILERIEEGYAEVDLTGTYVFVNDSFCRITGRSASELLGVNYTKLFDREVSQLLFDTYHNVYKTGEPIEGFEYEVTRKDGTKRFVEESVSLKRDAEGRPIGFMGIRRDCTDRKRAEGALRESEERYRDLVENSHEFICTHDLDGVVLSANRAAVEVLGYDPNDYCGKKDFRDILVPEVRDLFDDYLIRIRQDGFASGLMLMQTTSGERRVLEYHNTLRTDGVATPIVRSMTRDITEQRRAEKAMSDLRRELELTMNSMEEGVHRVDLKGNIVFENPAAARMLGWGIDQLLGKPAHLTMHHTRQDGTPYPKEECPIDATFRDGVSRQVADEVFWRQDGTSFPVEYMTAPMRNDRNEIVAAVVTFRDVTERKRADEKLQNSEKYFRSLIENASDLITVSDGNGIIRYESPSLERMLGYKPEERMGKSVLDLLHPDDLPFAKRHFAKGIRNPGIVHVMECRFQHKDGSWHLLETTGINLLDDPVVAGIVVNSRDITERKQAEEALRESEIKFRTLAETAASAILMYQDDKLIYANRATAAITGYSADELVGMGLWDLAHPAFKAILMWRRRARERGESVPLRNEIKFITKSGEERWADYTVGFIPFEGKPTTIGTAFDITERKQAEAEITELLTREQAARQKAEVMRDANVALTQNLSLETVLETLLAHLGKLIPYDSASVMLRESETKFVVRQLYGYEKFQDVAALTRAITLDVNENALLRQICTTGKSLLIADTDGEPAWQKLPGTEHVRCWLGVPLIAYGKVIGLYSMDKAEPGVFTPEHIRMAETLAIQAASAIQNAQLFEQGQRYAAELEQRIAERERAEEGLRISHGQLRALSARLQTAREEEGSRIGREIHDELGGTLTSLKWDLEGIDKVLSGAGNSARVQTVREKLPNMTGLIESTINTVRRISSELRPGVLDDLGLVAAIAWQGQHFQSRTEIKCECVADTDALGLNRERATAVFRILQEILTNVIRHAQATKVDIELSERDGYVELCVKDNGRGITEEEMRNPRSLGLLGMRERALLVGGEVSISGVQGKGTTVVVRVPVQRRKGRNRNNGTGKRAK